MQNRKRILPAREAVCPGVPGDAQRQRPKPHRSISQRMDRRRDIASCRHVHICGLLAENGVPRLRSEVQRRLVKLPHLICVAVTLDLTDALGQQSIRTRFLHILLAVSNRCHRGPRSVRDEESTTRRRHRCPRSHPTTVTTSASVVVATYPLLLWVHATSAPASRQFSTWCRRYAHGVNRRSPHDKCQRKS
jgi:hypothetical protein